MSCTLEVKPVIHNFLVIRRLYVGLVGQMCNVLPLSLVHVYNYKFRDVLMEIWEAVLDIGVCRIVAVS